MRDSYYVGIYIVIALLLAGCVVHSFNEDCDTNKHYGITVDEGD